MPNRIFCDACGAPLSGVGAACTACGATSRPAAYAWAVPPTGGVPDRERSSTSAALLGLIPGLGHLYAGHRVKGLAIFSAFVAALFVGTDLDLTVVGAAVGVPLDAGGLGIWLFSMLDAYWTVRQDNRVVQAASGSTPSLR